MLVIDAANVVGSRPTGWWRDRPKAGGEFVRRLRTATASGRLPTPVMVVLEGDFRAGMEEGVIDGVHVVHAPRGGDDTLVAITEAAQEEVVLVTADRELRARVEVLGADVVGPTWIWGRLDT